MSEEKNYMIHRRYFWLAALTAMTAAVIIGIIIGGSRSEKIFGGSSLEYRIECAAPQAASLTDAELSGSDERPLISVSDTSGIRIFDISDNMISAAQSAAGSGAKVSFDVKSDNCGTLIISYDHSIEANGNETAFIEKTLVESFSDCDVSFVRASSFDTESGKSLLIQCIAALVLTFAAMSVYTGRKYKKLGALSVSVSCAAATLLDFGAAYFSLVLFRIPVDENLFAAMIAVLGCTVNSSIVLFDSILENTKYFGDSVSFAQIADRSIDNSMRRTGITGVCVIIAAAVTAITASALKEPEVAKLCIPVIFAVISGFFTSMFISSSIWVTWREKTQGKFFIK